MYLQIKVAVQSRVQIFVIGQWLSREFSEEQCVSCYPSVYVTAGLMTSTHRVGSKKSKGPFCGIQAFIIPLQYEKSDILVRNTIEEVKKIWPWWKKSCRFLCQTLSLNCNKYLGFPTFGIFDLSGCQCGKKQSVFELEFPKKLAAVYSSFDARDPACSART